MREPVRAGADERCGARADGVGVALRPLGDFGTVPSTDRTVSPVLGYAHLAPRNIAQSVWLLAAAQRDTNGPDIGEGRGRVFI
ncbi:hypothetical protein [Streptomyces sp. NPDC002785]|uniref:hypothetical protein n=1 Tax=Streptomyces sp. NPDC002785 TaxID=3154543 RepID=UPI003325BDAF